MWTTPWWCWTQPLVPIPKDSLRDLAVDFFRWWLMVYYGTVSGWNSCFFEGSGNPSTKAWEDYPQVIPGNNLTKLVSFRKTCVWHQNSQDGFVEFGMGHYSARCWRSSVVMDLPMVGADHGATNDGTSNLHGVLWIWWSLFCFTLISWRPSLKSIIFPHHLISLSLTIKNNTGRHVTFFGAGGANGSRSSFSWGLWCWKIHFQTRRISPTRPLCERPLCELPTRRWKVNVGETCGPSRIQVCLVRLGSETAREHNYQRHYWESMVKTCNNEPIGTRP